MGVGVGAGGGAGGGAASGGTVRERAEGGRRGSFRDTPSSTPATATPTSYRRATANHRTAAVVGATGPPPRYEISEYTFEREQPDSPFSDEKDSEEKKKGRSPWEGGVAGPRRETGRGSQERRSFFRRRRKGRMAVINKIIGAFMPRIYSSVAVFFLLFFL